MPPPTIWVGGGQGRDTSPLHHGRGEGRHFPFRGWPLSHAIESRSWARDRLASRVTCRPSDHNCIRDLLVQARSTGIVSGKPGTGVAQVEMGVTSYLNFYSRNHHCTLYKSRVHMSRLDERHEALPQSYNNHYSGAIISDYLILSCCTMWPGGAD